MLTRMGGIARRCQWRRGIAKAPLQQPNGLVAQFSQAAQRRWRFGLGKEFQQDRSERDFPQRPHERMASRTTEAAGSRRGANRGSKESGIPEEAGEFESGALALFAALAGHSNEIWRAVRCFGFTGARKIGSNGRADRKIRAVADFGRRVRVHMGVINQIEHGLGSNAGVWIFQQPFDGRPDDASPAARGWR